MRHLGAHRLTVASGGIREGLAMRAFGEPVPQPRLVRAVTVESLLRHYGVWDEDDMEARAIRADTLSPDPIEDPFSETLEAARLASMLRALADAGIHPVDALLGEDLAGFDHTMLARVAAILYLIEGDREAARAFLSLLPGSEKRLLRHCAELLA